MKVLSIGTDRNVFVDQSSVRDRIVQYAQELEALHTIVFAKRNLGFQKEQVSPSLCLYPTNSGSPLGYVWDGIRLGMKIIKTEKFVRGDSVITCQDPFETSITGYILSRIYRIPLHVQLHTDLFSPFFATTLLQKIRVRIARFILPRADRVRVVHKDIAKNFSTNGITLRHEVQVLPIRVNREYVENSVPFDFKKMYPQFHVVILMVNRLNPEKGIDTALRACKEVIEQYPFVGLFIVGDGPEKQPLELLAQTLGIEKNVVFMGNRGDIGSLLKSSHIFLSTSRFEGYGMTLVEAGLTQTAVVTTDVGLAHELIIPERNGIICKVDDEGAIRKGIVEYIHYPLKRSEYGKELHAVVDPLVPTKEEYIRRYIEGLTETLTK